MMAICVVHDDFSGFSVESDFDERRCLKMCLRALAMRRGGVGDDLQNVSHG